MNLEDYIKDLDPELQKRARACESIDELLALAKEAKLPLPDEAVAAIAGGNAPDPQNCGDDKCPSCGSKNTAVYKVDRSFMCEVFHYRCKDCGREWQVEFFDD